MTTEYDLAEIIKEAPTWEDAARWAADELGVKLEPERPRMAGFRNNYVKNDAMRNTSRRDG